jgi:hypothetical protein
MRRSLPVSRTLRLLAFVAIAFGLLTVLSGGRALFGSAESRAAMGATVGFVLWFNFSAGFAYVLAGLGLWRRRSWAAWLALALAAGTALVAAAFALHVARGGAYEMRTVGALALRLAFWTITGGLAWRAGFIHRR